MFEIPDSKRVRREELYDSSQDGSDSQDEASDPTLMKKLNAQLSSLLDLDFQVARTHDQTTAPGHAALSSAGADGGLDEGDEQSDEQLEFSFRLFRNEEPSNTIVLEPRDDKGGASGDSGFVVARRPMSYYIADKPTPQAAASFRYAAVSIDDLFADAKRRKWGLEKPWKVIQVTMKDTAKQGTGIEGNSKHGEAHQKRKRPGKQRRIILRTREKIKKQKEEEAKKFAADKDQHIADKKKRLNRQKKLKRRQKQREEKGGTNAEGGDDGLSDDSGGD